MRTFPDAVAFCLSAAVSALRGKRYLSCLWELTYRCNARCGMCGYWRHPSRAEDELSLDEITLGIDHIFAYGCRLVNFTGGEPMLRHDLEQIVHYASGRNIWTSVVTNGFLLTRDGVRRLRRAGLDNLLISLDSVSASAHDEQRGIPGSHAKAVECAGWIRDDFLKGHRTGGVMCVISRRNSTELPELVRFAREQKVFILFQPYHTNKTGDAEPVAALDESQIRPLLERNADGLAVLNSRSYVRELGRFGRTRESSPCNAGQKYFSIDPYGYLHPCVDMPAFGHILKNDVAVVRSESARQAISHCRGCWYCFRGEADTSLTWKGCLEKAVLALAIVRHNRSLRG
jgi:PqqA peptide cyclase